MHEEVQKYKLQLLDHEISNFHLIKAKAFHEYLAQLQIPFDMEYEISQKMKSMGRVDVFIIEGLATPKK